MFELTEEQLAQLAREHRAALEALRAFGEAIASCVRARLVARAMDCGDVVWCVGPTVFVASRRPGHWRVERWYMASKEDVAIIAGSPADTAAEVVDTLLRLAAEWGER